MATEAQIRANRQNAKKTKGRPKGKKNKKTLEREAVLRAMQQRIMEAADVLLDRQMHLAQGVSYLYKIEKYRDYDNAPKGKEYIIKSKPPKLVKSELEIREYLSNLVEAANNGTVNELNDDKEATYYYITTEKPNASSIEAMYNRTFGRSVTPVSVVDDEGKSVFDHESKAKTDKVVSKLLESK